MDRETGDNEAGTRKGDKGATKGRGQRMTKGQRGDKEKGGREGEKGGTSGDCGEEAD